LLKSIKGAFEKYSFVINNLIKHADAKAYNRHVATGMMKLGELILVGQEALGLLLLENYCGPWEQLARLGFPISSSDPSSLGPHANDSPLN
jgi:hypothetical protein